MNKQIKKLLTFCFISSIIIGAKVYAESGLIPFKVNDPKLSQSSNCFIFTKSLKPLSKPDQYSITMKNVLKKPTTMQIVPDNETQPKMVTLKQDINVFVVDCKQKRLNLAKSTLFDIEGKKVKTVNVLNPSTWVPKANEAVAPGLSTDVYNYVCKTAVK